MKMYENSAVYVRKNTERTPAVDKAVEVAKSIEAKLREENAFPTIFVANADTGTSTEKDCPIAVSSYKSKDGTERCQIVLSRNKQQIEMSVIGNGIGYLKCGAFYQSKDGANHYKEIEANELDKQLTKAYGIIAGLAKSSDRVPQPVFDEFLAFKRGVSADSPKCTNKDGKEVAEYYADVKDASYDGTNGKVEAYEISIHNHSNQSLVLKLDKDGMLHKVVTIVGKEEDGKMKYSAIPVTKEDVEDLCATNAHFGLYAKVAFNLAEFPEKSDVTEAKVSDKWAENR